MFLSSDELLLEPLIGAYAPAVVDSLANSEWENYLVENVMVSMLTTSPAIKAACLDFLLPHFSRLTPSQKVRIVTLCSEYPPEPINLDWLFSRYPQLVTRVIETADSDAGLPTAVVTAYHQHTAELKKVSLDLYLKVVCQHPIFLKFFSYEGLLRDTADCSLELLIKHFPDLAKSFDADRLSDVVFRELSKAPLSKRLAALQSLASLEEDKAVCVFGTLREAMKSEETGIVLKRFSLLISSLVASLEASADWRAQKRLLELMETVTFRGYFSNHFYKQHKEAFSQSLLLAHFTPFFTFLINQLLQIVPRVGNQVVRQIGSLLARACFYSPTNSILSFYLSQLQACSINRHPSHHLLVIYVLEHLRFSKLASRLQVPVESMLKIHPHCSSALIEVVRDMPSDLKAPFVDLLNSVSLHKHAQSRLEQAKKPSSKLHRLSRRLVTEDAEWRRIEEFRSYFEPKLRSDEDKHRLVLKPINTSMNKHRSSLKSSSIHSQPTSNTSNKTLVPKSKKQLQRKHTMEDLSLSSAVTSSAQVMDSRLNPIIFPPRGPKKQASLSNQTLPQSTVFTLVQKPQASQPVPAPSSRQTTLATLRQISHGLPSKSTAVSSSSNSLNQSKRSAFKVTSRKENLAPVLQPKKPQLQTKDKSN